MGALEIIAVGAGGGHGINSGNGKIRSQLHHQHVLKIPGIPSNLRLAKIKVEDWLARRSRKSELGVSAQEAGL